MYVCVCSSPPSCLSCPRNQSHRIIIIFQKSPSNVCRKLQWFLVFMLFYCKFPIISPFKALFSYFITFSCISLWANCIFVCVSSVAKTAVKQISVLMTSEDYFRFCLVNVDFLPLLHMFPLSGLPL